MSIETKAFDAYSEDRQQASGLDGYSSVITYAQSLLHVLSVTNRKSISQDDLYNVYDLIMEMLPTSSQMYDLQRLEQGK